MELWTGALSWWKCHWPDFKSAILFRRNLFLNSFKTSTKYSLMTVCPVGTQCMPVLSKKVSSRVCWWICSVWPSWVRERQHASTGNSVSWSLGHSSRSSFHCMAFLPSLKQNFIAYRSSKSRLHFWNSPAVTIIFEILQLWQSGFSRVYSNSCCSCLFESEIITIGKSSYKMYSNSILNFQESTTILNACTKRLETYWIYIIYIYIYIYMYINLYIYIYIYIYIRQYVISCD